MNQASASYMEVGRVCAIYRYPVKSMAGEELQGARLGWHGVAGDRRFAFLREEDHSGLPWLSARDTPALLGYGASYEKDEGVDRGKAIVVTPTAKQLPVGSDGLREEIEHLSGDALRLVRLHRGAYDSMALSIISTNSIASVAGMVESDVDPRRFRPNILIQSFDDHPFPEDRWVGDLLVFGETPEAARVRINRRDSRCSVINICPDTLEVQKSLLGTIVRERRNLCGVYCSTERPGTVKVGDVIRRRTL